MYISLVICLPLLVSAFILARHLFYPSYIHRIHLTAVLSHRHWTQVGSLGIKCVQLCVLFTAIIDVRRECGVAVVGKLAASQGPRQPPRERINLHDNIHPRNRRQCGHTAPNNDTVCDRSSRSHRWFLASSPLVTTRPPSVVAGYKKRLFLFLDRFLGARSLRLRRHADFQGNNYAASR